MNLTAYLGVNIENWQKGWKQAEGQSDAAFSKITAQMEKTEKSIKSLENSMKSGRERLSERLQNMGATAEQQSAILSRYDYSQKLKEQIAQTKELQKAEQGRIETLKNIAVMAKSAIVGAFAIGGVKGLIEMADGYTQLTAQIKNTVSSQEELEYIQKRLSDNTKSTYRSLSEATQSYINLSGSLKEIGYSTKSVLDINDAITFAFTANATSADKAQSAILALNKAFATGKMDSKGFQSILLAIPDITEKLAQNMGKSASEIRQLGLAGELSVTEFANALIKARPEYERLADSMSVSLKDGFQYFKNALMEFIGTANNASGATNTLAGGLKFLGDNIKIIVQAFLVFAGIKAVSIFSTMAVAISGTVKAMGKSISAIMAESAAISANTKAWVANDIVRKGQGVGLAASSVNAAGAGIANVAGGLVGAGNLLKKIGSMIKGAGLVGIIGGVLAVTGQWQNTLDSVQYIWQSISRIGKQVFEDLKTGFSAIASGISEFFGQSNAFSGFFSQFDSGIFGVFEMVGKLADTVVATIRGVLVSLLAGIENTVQTVILVIAKTIKGVLDVAENQLNKIVSAADWVNRKFGGDGIDFKFDLTPEALEDLASKQINIGVDLKDIFDNSFQEQRQNGLQAYFETMASEIRARREMQAKEQEAREQALKSFEDQNANLEKIVSETGRQAEKLKGKSATDIEIEIERLQASASKTADVFNKISELEIELSRLGGLNAVDWNEVSRAKGIAINSQVGIGTLGERDANAGIEQIEQIKEPIDRNIEALNANTEALKLANEQKTMRIQQQENSAMQQSQSIGRMEIYITKDKEKVAGEIMGTREFLSKFKSLLEDNLNEIAYSY